MIDGHHRIGRAEMNANIVACNSCFMLTLPLCGAAVRVSRIAGCAGHGAVSRGHIPVRGAQRDDSQLRRASGPQHCPRSALLGEVSESCAVCFGLWLLPEVSYPGCFRCFSIACDQALLISTHVTLQAHTTRGSSELERDHPLVSSVGAAKVPFG